VNCHVRVKVNAHFLGRLAPFVGDVVARGELSPTTFWVSLDRFVIPARASAVLFLMDPRFYNRGALVE
jgi:hypothetical protein